MKQINKTPMIVARLKKAVGPDVNVEDLVVYEAIALNTLPLRKRHPLYKGAVANIDMLHSMADAVNKESIPLQVMHNSDVLPNGRVFYAEVMQVNGQPELRALFFMPAAETQQIELIESGTVDQVSVSVLSKKFLCSECGFDFFGPAVSLDNIWNGECTNGHVIGVDGVHGQMIGLDQWFEMSLVNQGGAQNARIQSPHTSRLDSTGFQRLAASGFDFNKLGLMAALDVEKGEMTEKTATFDLAALVATQVAAELKAATSEKKATDLEAALAAAKAEVTALTAKVEAHGTAGVQMAADFTKAKTFLAELATKALVAKGDKEPKVPEALDALLALIPATAVELATLLSPGGKSKGADVGTDKAPAASLAAFMTRKQ